MPESSETEGSRRKWKKAKEREEGKGRRILFLMCLPNEDHRQCTMQCTSRALSQVYEILMHQSIFRIWKVHSWNLFSDSLSSLLDILKALFLFPWVVCCLCPLSSIPTPFLYPHPPVLATLIITTTFYSVPSGTGYNFNALAWSSSSGIHTFKLPMFVEPCVSTATGCDTKSLLGINFVDPFRFQPVHAE